MVALVAVLLLLLFFRRRRRLHRQQMGKERPDLFNEGPSTARDENLPAHLQPVPFIVPSDADADGTEHAGLSTDRASMSERRISSSTVGGRPGTPSTSAGAGSSTVMSRKSGVPPSMRPVNIVQHDDAGMAPKAEEEPETVELPPAYTNIRG